MLSLGLLAVVLAGHRDRSPARSDGEAARTLDDGVLRTVVLGDSVARGAGDERGVGLSGALQNELQDRPASPVLNLGIDGARSWHVRRLLEQNHVRAAVRSADVIVISIGGNDLYGDSAARLLSRVAPVIQQYRTLARLDRMVATIRQLNPAARVYLLGLYNPYRRSTIASWVNRQVNLWDARLIMRFASSPAVRVVRICDLLERRDRLSSRDHFHPGSAGYAAIAGRIAASL